jgi:hypothetical protein
MSNIADIKANVDAHLCMSMLHVHASCLCNKLADYSVISGTISDAKQKRNKAKQSEKSKRKGK